jgi:hypothetical protein
VRLVGAVVVAEDFTDTLVVVVRAYFDMAAQRPDWYMGVLPGGNR